MGWEEQPQIPRSWGTRGDAEQENPSHCWGDLQAAPGVPHPPEPLDPAGNSLPGASCQPGKRFLSLVPDPTGFSAPSQDVSALISLSSHYLLTRQNSSFSSPFLRGFLTLWLLFPPISAFSWDLCFMGSAGRAGAGSAGNPGFWDVPGGKEALGVFSLNPKPGFALGCPCGLSIPWIFPGYSREPQGRFLQLVPNPHSQNCPRARPAGDSDSCVPSGPSGIPPASLSTRTTTFAGAGRRRPWEKFPGFGPDTHVALQFWGTLFSHFSPFFFPPFFPLPGSQQLQRSENSQAMHF